MRGAEVLFCWKYDFGMRCTAEAGGRGAAWLLCAVLGWLPVSSPDCDLCDGLYATIASSSLHKIVDHLHRLGGMPAMVCALIETFTGSRILVRL